MTSLLLEHTSHANVPDQYYNERWLGFGFFEEEQSFNHRIAHLSQECFTRQARLHQLLKTAVLDVRIAECNQYASALYREHAIATHQRYVAALIAEIQEQEALANLLSDCQYRSKPVEELEVALEAQLDRIFEFLIKTRVAFSNLFSLNKRNVCLGGNVWGLEIDMLPQEVFEHHLLVLGGGRRQARRTTKPGQPQRRRSPTQIQNPKHGPVKSTKSRQDKAAEQTPKKKSKTKPELA